MSTVGAKCALTQTELFTIYTVNHENVTVFCQIPSSKIDGMSYYRYSYLWWHL